MNLYPYLIISFIFLIYIVLAFKIYLSFSSTSINPMPKRKEIKKKPKCFGFLKDKPDDYELTDSPYSCENCELLMECAIGEQKGD